LIAEHDGPVVVIRGRELRAHCLEVVRQELIAGVDRVDDEIG
jgi:hypothetical protein